MSVIFVLLPLSLLVAAGFVAAFVWAVGHGQFDDLETPGLRVLTDAEERSDESLSASAAPRRTNGFEACEADTRDCDERAN
ncbi:MAG: cbb3-type cytochrome oxidase assembly protein CcoS [Planctomycetota bacterium]